jgi:DNA-binding transcriptional MerR regulator
MGIGELARRAGTTTRTVRYYVARGLLPPPTGGGSRSVYSYEHLVRLAAIRALKAEYLPLVEIRRRLAAMSLEEIEAQVVEPDRPEALLDAVGRPLDAPARPGPAGPGARGVAPAARARGELRLPSARPPAAPDAALGSAATGAAGAAVGSAAGLWRRVALAPGVELSFQPSADPARERAIAELVEEATRRLAAVRAGR